MNKLQAIEIVKQMAQVIKATAQEHQLILKAIEVLSALEEPKET